MTTLLLLTAENLANDSDSNPKNEPPDEPPNGDERAASILSKL